MGRLLLQNWELKLLAVAVAFAVWFVVVGSDRSRIALAAPVEYVGLGDDAVIVSDTRERVDVHMEIARWAATRITPESLRVRVNLTQAHEGENVVSLSGADVTAPAGVTVTRIAPSRVHVTVARATEASLRVVPQLRGSPAAGFVTGKVTVDPPAVQVKGPRSTIEGRRTVETAPVDISGTRAAVTQTVGLMLPEFVYPTRGGSVQVTVEIRRQGRS